ncbi:MAG TPA: transglycosylase SLT domain-containing protein [Bacteriovoracaceae bacterium]|nr:transglycosylase SLT domain-containing protein [Bacteriovoracaceae bacterium]
MASIFEKIAKSTLKALIKEGLDKVFQKSKIEKKETKKPLPESKKSTTYFLKNHPWRLCPVGEHWVRTHPLTVPASGKGPARETVRQGHCHSNPKGKSEFYTSDELREIAEIHFKTLISDPEAMPIPDSLDYPNGNKYDLLIAGWTKFWNEILKPDDPPTPDFIKALIATESSFELVKDQKSNDGLARGLIQVTDSTRKILQDLKGELRNHHIELNIDESRDPVTNIAAGIRWLHHKKFLAENRLKRKITWEEAAAEYKGIFNDIGKDKKTDDIMKKLKEIHQRLKDIRRKQ